MANIIKEQKVVDNHKRALLKYVILADGTAEANTILIDVSTLSNALNANNQLMVGGVHPKSNYRTTIKRIFGQSKANGYITLKWFNGAESNSEIVTISNGSFDYNFENLGDNAVIANPAVASVNATGKICFSTNALGVADAFTIFVDLRKDSQDYNAGQFNDPVAFNQGPAGLV